MLKINPTPEAIKFHYKEVSKIFEKIINEKIGRGLLEDSTRKFIKRYKNILIKGKPILLLKVHQKFEIIITNQDNDKLKKCFKRAYEDQFQKKYSKEFLNHLNIETCTYCNRNYTLDFKNLTNARAQLDHWFPKSEFPILALSFYNLIPSCHSCNHIKGKANDYDWLTALDNQNHPYLNKSDFSFSFKFEKYNKPKVTVKPKDLKTENTINFNKTKEIYEAQSGKELKDLLDLRYKYSKNYLDILCNETFKGLRLSQEEAYRMIFGIVTEERNFHKRPFSKFKKDIIEELKNN
jgi:hypothetical protein